MRVFVYEYLCAGGAIRDCLPISMLAEGKAMLSALLTDFGNIPGVKTVTLLDESLHSGDFSGRILQAVRSDEVGTFRRLARDADHVLVIAPETDDFLLDRTQMVEEARGRMLGTSSAGVRVTADKWSLAKFLAAHDVPTPATTVVTPTLQAADLAFPLVWKLRGSAGSDGICLLKRPEDLVRCLADCDDGKDRLVQPFVPGQPASVAFLKGPRTCLALPPAPQHLSDDGLFRYRGGSMPLASDVSQRAVSLARRVVDAVPGLGGYVGVDLVLGPEMDGKQDFVIEVNPRVTTSYVGLRRLARSNLAELLLNVVRGLDVDEPKWREETVTFLADGTCTALASGPGSLRRPGHRLLGEERP